MTRFSKKVWNDLADLTIAEAETISRYERQPRGPLFMAAADILRRRGYVDEAIVIMEEGIRCYPHYHSARAALARDYFLKGMMKESNRQAQIVVDKSVDNLLAQRLKLKLAILFDDKDEVRRRLDILKNLFFDDEFTRAIRDLVSYDEWGGVQALVRAELEKLGIQYDASTNEETSDLALARLEAGASAVPEAWEIATHGNADPNTLRELDFSGEAPRDGGDEDDPGLPAALKQGTTLASVRGDEERYLPLKGFRRICAPGFFFQTTPISNRKVETLDTFTLAEIYRKQGLKARAEAVYRRILRDDPGNLAAREALERLDDLPEHKQAEPNTAPPPEAESPANRKRRVLERVLHRLEDRT